MYSPFMPNLKDFENLTEEIKVMIEKQEEEEDEEYMCDDHLEFR